MITLTSSIRVDLLEFMIVVGHIDQLQGNVANFSPLSFQLHLETRKATESESRGSEEWRGVTPS